MRTTDNRKERKMSPKKRWLLLLTICCGILVLSVTVGLALGGNIRKSGSMPGDVNEDGKVDIGDVADILNHLTVKETEAPKKLSTVYYSPSSI